MAAQQAAVATRIDAVLPQTQCTRCGYPDCASYAQAVAAEQAEINQCPPGGNEGIQRLAKVTGRPALPLNPEFGSEGPFAVAVIDENWCIGCTLCLKACPTDAIIGTSKRMHTVQESYCTGCELCIPVCPVDCIEMVSSDNEQPFWNAWSTEQANQARERYHWHQQRTAREVQEHQDRQERKAQAKLADLAAHSKHTDAATLDKKKALIEAALAKARAQRQGQ